MRWDWKICHGLGDRAWRALDTASGKYEQMLARRGEFWGRHPTYSCRSSQTADLGVILFQSYDPDIAYATADVQLLSFVAQHIATALARDRAIEEIRQRNAEPTIINSVQAVSYLVAQMDMQAVYDLVGDSIGRDISLAAQSCSWPAWIESPAWKPSITCTARIGNNISSPGHTINYANIFCVPAARF
jgi:hypothetical protein